MIKTPLEDFTTEILSGILNNNKEVGDSFVNNILNIEGSDFSISTQESFLLNEENCQDCRIDMIIRSENMICFVENKVESKEGNIQLERYIKVLDSFNPQLNTYLKYCTKYYDNKIVDRHNFHQFRWADVYRFLEPWQNSTIISEYLDFLNENNMSDNMDFTLNDLLSLQQLNPVVKKMDRYLEKIKPIFDKYFSKSKFKEVSNLKQIQRNSRYVFLIESIYGENGYSEFGVGFSFSDIPCLKVWMWTDQKNLKSKEFKKSITNHVSLLSNNENWIGSSKPISDFISSEEIEVEIEQWFVETFKIFKSFIESSKHLDWHI